MRTLTLTMALLVGCTAAPCPEHTHAVDAGDCELDPCYDFAPDGGVDPNPDYVCGVGVAPDGTYGCRCERH